MFKKIREALSISPALVDENKRLSDALQRAITRSGDNRYLYLKLLREVRSLNRTVDRKSRTIKRLRNQIALDAPTHLPPLAQTPEGRALYNHAYQMGRRKGRRDQIVGDNSPVGVGDGTNSLEHSDAIGLGADPGIEVGATTHPAEQAFEAPPQDAVDAVAKVRDTVVNDVPVPHASNDEVSVEAPPPVAPVRHLRSVPSTVSDDERPGS